jgi:hypothetical protein
MGHCAVFCGRAISFSGEVPFHYGTVFIAHAQPLPSPSPLKSSFHTGSFQGIKTALWVIPRTRRVSLLRRHANRIERDECSGVERSIDLLDRPAFGFEAEQQEHQRCLTVPEGEE